MTTEIWKPAVGCDGYFISSHGRIKSSKKGKIIYLNPFIQNRGYLQIGITVNKRKINKTIHSIVAESFIGPRNGMEINHKDGNKLNNCVENLEYATRSANMRHAVEAGLHVSGNAKLSYEIAEFIRKDKKETGRTEAFYATMFGCNKSNISHIMTGRNWKRKPIDINAKCPQPT